jgi:hypothetical protein
MRAFRAAAVTLGVLVPVVGASAASAETVSKTFNYTGAEQTFTVPEGVTSLHVVATGAGSASSQEYNGLPVAAGGRGAVVSGNLTVSSGTLYVEVGGTGQERLGGFNGGGAGSGGGGGASDVRTTMRSEPNTLAARLLVAAGGGGGGAQRGCLGGAGGDAGASGGTGERSSTGGCEPGLGNTGGGPGTETAGGFAGEGPSENGPSEAGSLGVGGTGNVGGGGGGGGLYGGGGGAPDGCGPFGPCWAAGGGGGGSNLVPNSGTATLDENGAPPQITITYAIEAARPPGHGCERDHSRRERGRGGPDRGPRRR